MNRMRFRHLGWILGLILGLCDMGRAADSTAQKVSAKQQPEPVPLPSSLTAQEPSTTRLPGDFSIVALPDTQMYTAELGGGRPEMFVAQADWIISNRISRNIAYVTLEGDISNNGNKYEVQWYRATNAMYRLEEPGRTGLPDGIPYGAVVGNHDEMAGGTRCFNKYFGPSHFMKHQYYGGHFGANNDSHYDLFSVGGQDFIVLSLTYAAGLNTNLLNWANNVLQSNLNRKAIVVSHSLIGTSHRPRQARWTSQGAPIFSALTNNPNLFLMLCGHIHGQGSRHEMVRDTNGGHAVNILLSDYQSWHGGDGFLRLLEFSPSNHVIRVKTFSPWLGQWSTNSDGMFTLDYPALPRGPNTVSQE